MGSRRISLGQCLLIGGSGGIFDRTGYWPLRFAGPSTPSGAVLVPDATRIGDPQSSTGSTLVRGPRTRIGSPMSSPSASRFQHKRKHGLNRGESERGIVAIGMPLHSGGRAVAATSAPVRVVRFSSARLREMLPAVRAAAAAIDAELGNASRQWRQVAN
jgi:hypothetical protein